MLTISSRTAFGSLSELVFVCERFAHGWTNSLADIDCALAHVAPDSRPTLLRNLLQIDVRLRAAAGQEPQAKDYVQRWPEYADVIYDEFGHLTRAFDGRLLHGPERDDSLTQSLSTNKLPNLANDSLATAALTARSLAAGDDTLTTIEHSRKNDDIPMLAVRLGDYQLERELGRGNMGVVYEATHVRLGAKVALKTLPPDKHEQLHRFKQEFRILAQFNHENLAGLHELMHDAGQWFLTMDLVQGVDFLSYVRPNGLDETRLRTALAQLVAGVHALHRRDVVHRDIKPSNIMVSESGQLRLLDFGIVVDLRAECVDGIAGTPLYMAPEQCVPATAVVESDWYAVGVVLYEALCGAPPFAGSIGEIFKQKRASPPPPLPAAAPADLKELCLQLLQANPAARPSGEQILGRVATAEGQPVSELSTPTVLVGLDESVCQLRGAFDTFSSSDGPQGIMVCGKSGEGKTALVEHCLLALRQDPQWLLLTGRCYDRESVPYKAIDVVIDALSIWLLRTNEAGRFLSEDTAILRKIFPVLARVPEIASLSAPTLDALESSQIEQLIVRAMKSLLRNLANELQVLVFIDDLQWGDAESAALLRQVLSGDDAPRILFLGTYRDDEADTSQFLRDWSENSQSGDAHCMPCQRCQLQTLDDQDCARLVAQILGEDNDETRQLAKSMAAETGGNPFLLSELASSYKHVGATGDMRLESVLTQKLQRLPSEATQLLEVVSVSGQALSMVEACQAAGFDALPLGTIVRMRSERLLRGVGGDEECIDTYHDRVREAVLHDLAPESRKHWHRQLGETILLDQPIQQADATESETDNQWHARVYDLAYHFHEAEDPRAFEYQLQAGEAAVNAQAFDVAQGHFSKASKTKPSDVSRQFQYRLWERWGKANAHSRNAADAIDCFERALPFAGNFYEQAAIHESLGLVRQWQGEFSESLAAFELALHALGGGRRRSLVGMGVESAWMTFLCHFSVLVPKLRSKAARRKAEQLSLVLHRIAQVHLAKGRLFSYVHACLRACFFAFRGGSSELLRLAYVKLAYNYAAGAMIPISDWMAKKAARHAHDGDLGGDQSSDVRPMIEALMGTTQYCAGRMDAAEQSLNTARIALERHGANWYLMSTYHHLRHVYTVGSRLQDELHAAMQELRYGKAFADHDTICWAEFGLSGAYARSGQIQQGLLHARNSVTVISGRGSPLSECICWAQAGFAWMQASRYELGLQALLKARDLQEQNWLYLEYMAYAYPRILECHLGPRWTTADKDKQSTRLAWAASWKVWGVACRFPNVRSHAWRMLGRLHWRRGSQAKARRSFARALQSARDVGAPFDEARSLLDLAAIDVDARNAARRRQQAAEILRRIQAVVPRCEAWLLPDDCDDCIAVEQARLEDFPELVLL